ncbi:MAG: hypothetical protein ACI3VB_04965 [Oscillospiraceae bacterium]
MEAYRSKLKAQNIFLIIAAAALAAVQVLSYCRVIKPLAGGDFIDFWNGFIGGLALGLMAILIFGVIKNLRAMRSEKALKKLYAKENDERTEQIYLKGKSAGATIFLLCCLPAAVIAGYFSITVFITCVACILTLSVMMGVSKLYYSKKL